MFWRFSGSLTGPERTLREIPHAQPTSSGSTSRRYARVEGVDPEGNERAFRLQNNPDSFGDTDYDDMVQYGTIDAKQVLQSPIIGWILERVGENRQHFETDVP